MPPPETFWGTIVGSMAVVTILSFIGLHTSEHKDMRFSPNILFGSVLVALMIGVMVGGVAGLIIFALTQVGRR